MVESEMPCFFKVMLGDFEQRLTIPPAFSHHLSTMSSDKATLQGASGIHWPVGVKRTVNSIFLEEGWGEFLRAHRITFGEFLVFAYDGDTNFSVQIFGTSAVERVTNPQDVTDCEGHRRHGRPGKAQTLNHLGSTSTNNQQSCLLEKLKQVRIHQPASPKDETLENVGAIEDASFTVTLQPSYEHYMGIPAKFSKKYLKNEVEKVTLVVSDGRTWDVKVNADARKCYRLTVGWKPFREEMKLNDGDVCVFKMIKRNNLVFKVSILRAVRIIDCPD